MSNREPEANLDTRDRLSAGLNVTRARLEARRSLTSLPPVIVGVIATLVGAALIFSQLTPTLFKSTREARFAISDGFGVLVGVNQVRYRGVPAGTIRKLERRGTQLVLLVTVRKDFPIYRDARAELRPETPLNDMYLDVIDPGTKQAGELGGDEVLAESQTQQNVKINDVFNALQPATRTRLAQMLDNLGNGLQDRGAMLRASLDELAPFIASAGEISGAVAKNERLTKRLIHNAGILTTTLGRRQRELRTLVTAGSATLGAFQQASPDLDQTLRELPPTMREISASFAAVRGVVGDVDQAVTDLNPVADRVPEALRDVKTLNTALSPAVRALASPVGRLAPLIRSLQPVARDGAVSVDALRPQVPSIDKIAVGLVKCEDAVVSFFQWNSSLSKFGDVRGPIPRGNFAYNSGDSPGAPGKKRQPAKNCSGGATIDGRVPTSEDAG